LKESECVLAKEELAKQSIATQQQHTENAQLKKELSELRRQLEEKEKTIASSNASNKSSSAASLTTGSSSSPTSVRGTNARPSSYSPHASPQITVISSATSARGIKPESSPRSDLAEVEEEVESIYVSMPRASRFTRRPHVVSTSYEKKLLEQELLQAKRMSDAIIGGGLGRREGMVQLHHSFSFIRNSFSFRSFFHFSIFIFF
jgi:hypothetical protein